MQVSSCSHVCIVVYAEQEPISTAEVSECMYFLAAMHGRVNHKTVLLVMEQCIPHVTTLSIYTAHICGGKCQLTGS